MHIAAELSCAVHLDACLTKLFAFWFHKGRVRSVLSTDIKPVNLQMLLCLVILVSSLFFNFLVVIKKNLIFIFVGILP